FNDRLNALKELWEIIPEFVKTNIFNWIISQAFYIYYQGLAAWTEKEQKSFFKEVQTFYNNRKEYFLWTDNNGQSFIFYLAKQIEKNNFEKFLDACNDLYNISQIDKEPADLYIATTYYQIYKSIIFAIKNKKPARLYIDYGYQQIPKEFAEKIKNTGIFKDVILFDVAQQIPELIKKINKNPEDAKYIIPSYLYERYMEIFRNANKNDTVYCFLTHQPYWYFIERYFNSIIKVEDAYDTFAAEDMGLIGATGIWCQIMNFIGNGYPPIDFSSHKISKIIVSVMPENQPEELSRKIEVIDMKTFGVDIKEKLIPIFQELFDLDISLFNENTFLILTQPLAKMGHCSDEEQKTIYKNIAKKYGKGKTIIIKPHPADILDYSDLAFPIISKNAPIEVYAISGIYVNTAVTFASRSIKTINFAKNKIEIYPYKTINAEYKKMLKELLDYDKIKTDKVVKANNISAKQKFIRKILPKSLRKKIKNKIKKII
ncbi:MAG: glycosyltransferase family 52 protein, partial [Clostridiales Family XIII bacterium]|nr:glycosyltransferase family 52 protein [Clostridiales Family XIII bacterium]